MDNTSPEILYEDEDILAVNKPAGLVVHADGRTEEPTLAEWFVQKYPEAKGVGESITLQATSSKPQAVIERPGVVHRLDRETSGVLLLAKTKKGFDCLKSQFQNREVEKTYHAFLYGKLSEEQGTINLPIGRSSGDFRKWSAQRGGRGEKREATTFFKVLSYNPEHNVTLVEAKPKTGRTHQIRVHFQALQRPVVADSLYAAGKPKLLGFARTALHAREITFTNTKGERVTLTAPYPRDFEEAVDIVGGSVLD